MRRWGCFTCAGSLMTALWTINTQAAEFRRFDGVHRLEKKAQITQAPSLERRDEAVCGKNLKQCASSFDGGCCPENYECAKESCYATTKGPSTCGARVGWYVCDSVYGDGCCPDGYLCERGDNCIPPSGSAYTYDCPASHFLCPASMSYGCCPNGMGCAVNQCYSTEAVTVTNTLTLTTTEFDGTRTYRSTAVTVQTPTEPTALPTVNGGSNGDQAVLKYFPSSVPKVSPSSEPESGGGGGGMSTGMLAGIIAGCVAFLVIVVVVAYITIRHLNKVVAAVSSKESDHSQQRPPARDYKLADSEADTISANPLMVQRPSHPAPPSTAASPYSPETSSNGPTPGGQGYHSVSNSVGDSRQTSFEITSPREDYFTTHPERFSQVSRFTQSTRNRASADSQGVYTHLRHPSATSDSSDGGTPAELEAAPWTSELPNSPSSVVYPRDDRRGSYSRQHQRARSDSLGQNGLSSVSEEMHGFHGPRDHLVGQTDTHRVGTGRDGGARQ